MIDIVMARIKPDDTEVVVTAEEYASLLCGLPNDFPPSPPVSYKSERFGFFSYEWAEERDHHAPEYLKDLDTWRQRQDLKKGPLVLLTAYGSVKVRIGN